MLRAVHGPSSLLLLALLLSGVGLLAGPLILSLGRGRAAAGAVVEGLALGLIPTMVLLRLLPHVAESLGGWAVALFVGAFLVLRAFDEAHHRAAARVGRAFIYSALALHSFTDGVGLAAAIAATPTHGAVDVTLTVAFVIHRLPEGLFIATTLLPTYGKRRTILRTLGLFAATVAGGLLGGALLPLLSERLFDAVVALGLGAMLQLVLHSHADRPTHGAARSLSSAALLVGVIVTLLVPAPGDLLTRARPEELSVSRSLLPLFVWTAPSLLVAIVIAAVLRAFVRVQAPLGELGRWRASLAGLWFGAVAPVGPAHGLPAARGLVHSGAAPGVVAAFVLSVTALALDAVIVSWRVLGLWLALARLAVAVAIALVGGALASRVSHTRPDDAPHASPRSGRGALASFTLHIFRGVDQLGASYVTGLVLAAALEAAIDVHWIAATPSLVWLLALPLLGLMTGVAPLVLVPIGAVLLHKGIGAGPVLALLVAGPIGGRARMSLLDARRTILFAYVTLIAMGIAANALVRDAQPALHAWARHHANPAELVASALLALLLLVSLLRLGPQLWFEQLLAERTHENLHEHVHE